MNDDNLGKRIIYTGYLIMAVFMVFFLRMWQLQVIEGKQHRYQSESNKIQVLKVAAPRGIIYDRNGFALVKNTPFYSVSLLPSAAKDTDTKSLSSLLTLHETDIVEAISTDVPPFETIKLKEGISLDEVAYIESRRSDFPGLIIETEVTRHYVYSNVASHVVGYLGMAGPEKLQTFKNSGIPHDAFMGTWGVEAYYDKEIMGKPGKTYIEVDALGRQLKIISEEPPQIGKDISISLDIGLQEKIEEAFEGRTGAAVAVDPGSGEILALVSLPSFNPNLFSRGISAADWREINNNPYYPFLNRALQSQFPPGSVFKIIVATAALEEGLLPENFKVTCNGKIRHGKWKYRCWRRSGHGVVDLHKAIVESCDVFFYEVGKLLGIEKIAEYSHKFGLGMPVGIGFVEEKTGFVPDSDWKEKEYHEPWFIGETYHASIGQGYVLATPFQQVQLISAIANGGIVYQPTIGKESETKRILRKIPLKPETLTTIKSALRGVVNEKHGTAWWTGRSRKYIFAGKTGTSQVIRERDEKEKEEDIPERFRDHAWFVAFAPYEAPKIAMSVFVEHGGHGASAAAPIAKKAMEYYLDKMEERKVSQVKEGASH